jgi:hypothetical protein
MNIFISGCAVVVSFSTGVTSVIASFAPSWPEALAFWVLSMLAVLAVALTACVGCCCCVVGVPVAVAQLAPPGTFRVRRIGADGNLRDYANGGGGRFIFHPRSLSAAVAASSRKRLLLIRGLRRVDMAFTANWLCFIIGTLRQNPAAAGSVLRPGSRQTRRMGVAAIGARRADIPPPRRKDQEYQ